MTFSLSLLSRSVYREAPVTERIAQISGKTGGENAGSIRKLRASLIFCRCNNEVIVTFLAGIKAPDEFRACARIGINHSYGLMYRFNNLLPAVKQVAGRDGVDRLAYMKPAGRSLPITPHHNSGVTRFYGHKNTAISEICGCPHVHSGCQTRSQNLLRRRNYKPERQEDQ